MSERIPNFVYGANYRAKSRYPSASAPRFNCFTPANPDIPAKAYVADCWVCDAFGRIDPGPSRPFRFAKRIWVASSTPSTEASECDRHPMNLQELSNQVREIPLCDLLQWHGFEIKSEALLSVPRTTVITSLLPEIVGLTTRPDSEGRGAIDLQMHLTGENFAAACQTLARHFRSLSYAEIGLSFPIERHIRSEQERRPLHELAARYAVPNEENWPIARAYLVETRGIDAAVVDDLHAVGTIFANDHRPNPSIVFLHRSQHGKVEGATLRDTRQQSSFRPCLGNKLTAWFTVGHLDKAEIVIAVESPIDALSYRTIHACRGDAWAVVSCAGATVPNELMKLVYDRRQSFVVALDNDPAGERGWRKAWEETVDWNGFRISSACPKHKDWNDDLMSLQLARRRTRQSLSNG
jgi:hypothetical protein